MRLSLAVVGCVLAASVSTAAGSLQPRVMVLPIVDAEVGDAALGHDVVAALDRGARKTTPNVAVARASLDDTAAVVGCDPVQRACLDAVAAALNVDQILVTRLHPAPDGVEVEITAITREADPMTRRFTVHPATRAADLAAIQAAVPDLLESGDGRTGDGPPVPPVAIDHPRRHSKVPMILAITGGAAIVAGAICWGVASDKQGQIDRAPTATAVDLDHLVALESSGRHFALAGNVLVVGGGLAAAAGATWWFTSRHGSDHVVVTPVLAPQGAGVRLEARW